MADLQLPPVPPLTPPPSNLPPLGTPVQPKPLGVTLPVEEEQDFNDDETAKTTAALSPFAVLGKQGGSTPPPPTTPVPGTPTPPPSAPVAPVGALPPVQKPVATPQAPPRPGIAPLPTAPPAPTAPTTPAATPPASSLPLPPPIVPPPVQPVSFPVPADPTPPPTTETEREALLKQASEASQPFILPRRPVGQATPEFKPRAELKTDEERAQSLEKIEVATRKPEPVASAPKPPPPVQMPPPPAPPTKPIDLPTTRREAEIHTDFPSPASMVPPEAPKATPAAAEPVIKPKRSAPRLGPVAWIIGSVIALVLLGGGLTVLALSGTRIPLLSLLVSGLDGSTAKDIARAQTFVTASGSYHFAGNGTVALADSEKATFGDTTSTLYKLTVTTKEGISTDQGTRFLVSSEVTGNDNVAVPMALRSTGTVWVAAFAANRDTSPATVATTTMSDTLLAPVLNPIPLEVILKNVGTSVNYTKASLTNGKGQVLPAASYTLNLKGEGLSAYFPQGSIFSTGAQAKVALAWKGSTVKAGQPLDAEINGSFTYRERTYTYTFHWSYDFWGDTTPVQAENTELAGLDPASIVTPKLTAESFISRLGLDPKIVPVGEETTVDTTDTSFTPIFPSGDVITSVETERATNPPEPTQPATAEAKARDTQRKQDLQDIQKALEQFKKDTGAYPQVEGTVQLASTSSLFSQLVPKYLTKMPVDPLNETYYYTYTSLANLGSYQLTCVLEDNSDTDGIAGRVYHYYALPK